MARPQTFDTDEVLRAATLVFWEKGYRSTTIRDLVAATGIAESSIYHAFGGKRRLFEAVMDRYRAGSRRYLRRMEDHPSALEGLRFYVLGAAEGLASDRSGRGCLFTNTAIELAAHDEQIRDELRQVYADTLAAFGRVIARGQQAGEITDRMEPELLARFLQQSMEGLRVLAKSKPDPGSLQQMASTTLTLMAADDRTENAAR